MSEMKRMLANNNVAGPRLLGSAAVLAALAIGGVSLSTAANASLAAHGGGGGHGSHGHTIGQHNTTVSNHSPTHIRGIQNSSPTSSGGQNSIMNAFCRKAPCHISQKVNMLPWDVNAFIFFGPNDYLMVP